MAGSSGPNVVSNGLLFCLDGKNMKSYTGSGTAVTNLATKTNNGTLNNGPTFNSNGYWDFDGTNDHINAQDFFDTAALTSHASLTFEAWYNADSYSSGHGIVGYYGSGATGKRRGMIVWNGAGAGGFKVRMSTYGSNSYGNVAATTGTWTHSMVTLASDGANIIYQDGVRICNPADVTMNTPNDPAPILVGCTESSEFFNGKIAIARIYNKILTEREMLQNYNALKGRFT